VKFLGMDDRGKVRLSMKVVDQATGEDITERLKAERAERGEPEEREERAPRGDRGDRGGDRGRRPSRREAGE
jgi:polyribonucleotide nucleotidyltransferase